MKRGIIIIIIAVLFDQLTKQLAVHFLYDALSDSSKVIEVIPYLLKLSYATNRGASLGFLEGEIVLFIIITILALGLFGYLFKDVDFKSKKIYSLSITFFIAGTLGNFIDRLFLGHVIDFMNFPFLNFIAPFYNNWADMYLSLAIVLFAIDMLFLESKRKMKEENPHETTDN